MKIRPVGFQVLIEMEVVENEIQDGSLKGFQLATQQESKREQDGHDMGRVIAFGPIAFKGYANCNSPEDFGVKIGDIVEFKRYDGKVSSTDKQGKYRIVNDGDILMVIEHE